MLRPMIEKRNGNSYFYLAYYSTHNNKKITKEFYGDIDDSFNRIRFICKLAAGINRLEAFLCKNGLGKYERMSALFFTKDNKKWDSDCYLALPDMYYSLIEKALYKFLYSHKLDSDFSIINNNDFIKNIIEDIIFSGDLIDYWKKIPNGNEPIFINVINEIYRDAGETRSLDEKYIILDYDKSDTIVDHIELMSLYCRDAFGQIDKDPTCDDTHTFISLYKDTPFSESWKEYKKLHKKWVNKND